MFHCLATNCPSKFQLQFLPHILITAKAHGFLEKELHLGKKKKEEEELHLYISIP